MNLVDRAVRNAVLDDNRRFREGIERQRNADGGYVALRIPESDFYSLRKIFPALASTNASERHAAWQDFLKSPLGLAYRVVRDPRQVRQSDKHIIVR